MKKTAIIGTRGVPAHYGGFESLVENLLDHRSEDVQYTVFCSSKDLRPFASAPAPVYKGATLKYVCLHANGAQSMLYDLLSMLRCLRGYDCLLVLGVSGCIFLPFVRLFMSRKTRLVINIDGLEHKRDKWNRLARWILLTSEKMAVRYADTVIADNQAIADYVLQTYDARQRPGRLVTIAYGGDHVRLSLSEERCREILSRYGLTPGGYAISVCRIEPENNCQVTLDAFSRTPGLPLLLIGNWEHSEWARQLRERYAGRPGVICADAVYDLEVLYALRSGAALYIHGHSAGGTNPSLVEAMFFGKPIYAFDVSYNRESTFGKAAYFSDADGLCRLLAGEWACKGEELAVLAREHYRWADIAARYEALY